MLYTSPRSRQGVGPNDRTYPTLHRELALSALLRCPVTDSPSRPSPANTVSVIVPTMNSRALLTDCVMSVRNQTAAVLEVIVVDGGSRDATVELATDLGCVTVPGNYRRSSARRAGSTVAKGNWLLFVDSDQRLSPLVVGQCLDAALLWGAQSVIIPEVDRGTGIWLHCRKVDRTLSRLSELEYPRFILREVYWAVDGHRHGLEDFMEDRDLFRRLSTAGFRIAHVEAPIFNEMGQVNPFLLGIKGARSAKDAHLYYSGESSGGDRLSDVVSPRIRTLIRDPRVLRSDRLGSCLFPLYIVMTYGPRFFVALRGSLRSNPLRSLTR